MAFDGVPLFVENAEHSADLLRTMNYVMFGGQEGVLHAADWQVVPLSPAGAGVAIMPGVGAILNRAQGGDNQLYTSRLPSAATVDVDKTDTSGGRSDLIVVRVENPYITGEPWGIPADRKNGPYVFGRDLKGVPASTTKVSDLDATLGAQTAYACARLDIPKNTATITADMIKDLRQVSNPITGLGGGYEQVWTSAINCPAGSNIGASVSTWTRWPTEASWQVPIPSWATDVDINIVVYNAAQRVSGIYGQARAHIGARGYPATTFDINFTPPHSGDAQRVIVPVGGTHAVDADWQGTVQPVSLEVQTQSGTNSTGNLTADASTYIYAQLAFKQRPVMV